MFLHELEVKIDYDYISLPVYNALRRPRLINYVHKLAQPLEIEYSKAALLVKHSTQGALVTNNNRADVTNDRKIAAIYLFMLLPLLQEQPRLSLAFFQP